MLQLLQRRGIALRPLPAPGYGAALSAAVRKGEPERMLDSFLVAGLILARSHERMARLAAHSPDGELLASEACHFWLYWLLAEGRYGREATAIPPRCGCTRRGWSWGRWPKRNSLQPDGTANPT